VGARELAPTISQCLVVRFPNRDAISISDFAQRRRISRRRYPRARARARVSRRTDGRSFGPRCITLRQMKKYCLDLSTHEYHIRCNGLCALQATSTPFPKLNYLSLLRFPRAPVIVIPLPARISFCIMSNRPFFVGVSRELLQIPGDCPVQFPGVVIIKLRGKLRATRCGGGKCAEIPLIFVSPTVRARKKRNEV